MDSCFRCTYWNNCYIKSSFSEWRLKEVILKLHILQMRKPNAGRKVTLPKDAQLIKAQLNQNSPCRLSRALCFTTRLLYIEFCLIQQKIFNFISWSKSLWSRRVDAFSTLRKDEIILNFFTWSYSELRFYVHRCEMNENISYLKKGFFKSRIFPDLKPVWFTSAVIWMS